MGNSPPGNSYNEHGEGVPLINGPVEFSPGPFGLTRRTKFTTAPARMCRRGDLLVCVRGATTGRTNLASSDACIGRGVALVRARSNQHYLNYFMWSVGTDLLAVGTGTTFPAISADETPVRLADTTRLVLHVVPLGAASGAFAIDLRKLSTRNPQPVYRESSYGASFNLDGLVVVGDPNGETGHTYTQFFRDGSIEVVLTTIADEKHVYPTRIESHMVKTARVYLPTLVDAGVAYPFALTATLLGMKGRSAPSGNWGARTGTPIPRDEVFLPDIVVETDDTNFGGVLRPTFDALWQALGHDGSPNFDAKGEWTGNIK